MLNVSIVRYGAAAPLFEKEHLRRFLRDFEVDCVFDVGANEGQYAELLREIGFRRPIISFEPIPQLAAVLRRKAASDGQWYVEEIALDDRQRPVSFNVMRSSQFSSLKAPRHDETSRFSDENIVTSTVDVSTAVLAPIYRRYAQQLGFRRAYLKLDTQGNDLAVARGAGAALSEFVGLQSELAVKRIYADAPDYREALDFYLGAGFELSAFVPNNAGHFPTLIELDVILFNPDRRPA